MELAARDELASAEGAWAGGAPAVEGFLHLVAAELDRLPGVVVAHRVFDNYGSGFASFVELFLTRRDGGARRLTGEWEETDGFGLCLCRLAPVAVLLSPTTHSRGPNSTGGGDLPTLARVTSAPVTGWVTESEQVAGVLATHGVRLLDQVSLAVTIDPAIRIDSNLAAVRRPPYELFDAWFHWRD